ncbi:MAG: CHAT domain-containing protein [Candidatus Acidiferrum sp.]
MDRGEFNSTLPEVDTALKQFQSRSAFWEWRFRVLKARILVSRSQAENALSVLQPEPPPALATTEIPEQRLLYRGIAHRYVQQFAEAEQDLATARKLAEPLGAFYTCQFLIADADLSVDESKDDRAEADYRAALSLARRNRLLRLESAALADWGRLATKQRHFDESLDLSGAALNLAQSLDLRGNVATILGNLGWSYADLGDFEASRDFFKQSAEASARSGMSGYSAYWFTGLANAYMALGEYSAAEELSQDTLKKAQKLGDAETSVLCLNILADTMLRTNRLPDAERYNRQAQTIEATAKDSSAALDTVTLAAEIAAANGRSSVAEKLFGSILADSSSKPQSRWKAEAGIAKVRDAKGQFAEAERHYLRAISIIEKARRSIHHDELRLSFLSSGIAVYGDYIDFLIRRDRPGDALEQAELSRARTLEEGLSSDEQTMPARVTPQPEPRHLAQRLKATLLFYWLGEHRSYLWAVTPSRTTHFYLPGTAQIDPLVQSYREALLGPRDPLETANPDGRKLYELLVQPAAKLIPKGNRVILLPDGSLYALNFETLIVPQPKPHFWIEDVSLASASSLTMLASASARSAPKEKNLFLVGDTLSPNADFPALPQAHAEMQDIEKYFPVQRREILSGSGATPAAYLSSKPGEFAFLHFVTHGTASRARPLESAVILSQDKNDDSYKLYARDIVKRRLSAYLVTISACNGAGTRAYSGEGLVGLSWAFLRAGAHNVIGALWEVSDASTPQLMDKLYDGLSHGEDPASALRAAKLSLLHSDSVFRKPYYWAPFQLYAGS